MAFGLSAAAWSWYTRYSILYFYQVINLFDDYDCTYKSCWQKWNKNTADFYIYFSRISIYFDQATSFNCIISTILCCFTYYMTIASKENFCRQPPIQILWMEFFHWRYLLFVVIISFPERKNKQNCLLGDALYCIFFLCNLFELFLTQKMFLR